MVRCISGSVLDIVIDIRKDSTTFLKHFSLELSASNKKMLYVPYGFAHGFITLEDHTELIYQHTAYYKPQSEAGIKYSDPRIAIDLPVAVEVISDRDVDFTYLKTDFNGI